MNRTNILLMFIILAIIIAALWIGSKSASKTVFVDKHGNHHHQHNLGPGGELQPIHTIFINKDSNHHQHNLGPGGTQHMLGPGGTQHMLGPGGTQPML